jgi:prepilin-type N-terminal cleavage/methylation domain-containing protein
VKRIPDQRCAAKSEKGFTLIELLVSMAILIVIMLIISMIFQRATAAWDAGTRKAELDLTGRSVADFIAQELSMAARDTDQHAGFDVAGNTANFWLLGDADTNGTRAFIQVSYSGSGGVARNGTLIAEGITDVRFECNPASPMPPLDADLPLYADVTVTVTNDYRERVLYQSRAYFMNRTRNQF